MENFKLDDKVKIIGKNISGKIAFIGETHFSEGEWLGIILDEAKGRNNGSIDGHQYFKCPRNYGLFVRSCQLEQGNVETESDIDPKAKKITYPNYLENSTSLENKSEKRMKSSSLMKANNKSLASKIHPMKTVIDDLKDTLKYKSEEIFCLEKQKKEALDKVKGLKSEINKLYDALKQNAKKESNFKLEIKKMRNELMLLKRKLYKTEKCLLTSENNQRKLDVTVEGLREITEHAIIEKEIAEEKAEQFELLLKDETDKRKTIEIELDRTKESMKIQTVNGVPAIHYVTKIKNENEILKCALLRLKDLYDNLHNKLINSELEVKKYVKKIDDLKSSEKAMEDTLSKYQDETSELYDIIDSISNVDDIVFEVTERNLKAEETIKDLCQKLHDTENQLNVSEETEQELQEIRLMCRDEIENLEIKIRHMQTALNQKAILLQEREATITKYRELTSALQDRNRKLAKDLEAVNNDRKEAVVAAENLKLKIQREKRNITKDLIEKEILKCEFETYREEIDYCRLFMPETFFEDCGENAAIQAKLIASKMFKKLNLLTKLLQTTSYDVTKSEELKDLVVNTKLLTYVFELHACISLFIKSSDRINSEQILTIGKYHKTLEQQNKILDSFLNNFTNGDTNRNFCVTVKSMHCSLAQQLDIEYSTIEEKTIINLLCFLNMMQNNCKCLLLCCKSFENNGNNSEEFKSDINLMKEKVITIKLNIKLVLSIIENYENERIFLNQTVIEIVKKNSETIQDITNNILEKCAVLTEDEFTIKDSKNKEKISLNEIVHKCLIVDKDLDEFREKISNGDYFIESVPHTNFSAIYDWAQRKKQEKEEMINIMRSQISTSNSEIDNLKSRLFVAENTINKIQNIAKKDESQQTDGHEYFINQFSKEISNFSILTDMENTIKYLKQKNFELMSVSVKYPIEILNPLKVLPKHSKYRHDTHNLFIIQKRLNETSVKLTKILLPQIPDITRRTKSPKVIKYRRYLGEKMLIKREIEDELWNITVDLKKLKASFNTVFGRMQIHSPSEK